MGQFYFRFFLKKKKVEETTCGTLRNCHIFTLCSKLLLVTSAKLSVKSIYLAYFNTLACAIYFVKLES